MTAAVSMQNMMSPEYDNETPYVDASTSNDVTNDNALELKKDVKQENMQRLPSNETLEAMGLQPEAEDEASSEPVNNQERIKHKGSSKRKSDGSSFCEKYLGVMTPSQNEAIKRISTVEGLKQMQKWLESAQNDQDPRRLCSLLAQCWHAELSKKILSNSDIPIGKCVNQLRKHHDKNVKIAANEVKEKWKKLLENKSEEAPPPAQLSNIEDTEIEKSSTASQPKLESKTEIKTRPKARTKVTKRRLTGLEEDVDEESNPPKRVSISPRVSVQKPNVILKKTPGPAVPSNSFMNALSGNTNAIDLQKRRKKPPQMIEPQAISPMEPIFAPSSSASSTTNRNFDFEPIDPNGPDPNRVPAPGSKRRIHFADDKGEQLVYAKLIENLLRDPSHRTADMKHADAEAERLSLKQRKSDSEDEEEDEKEPKYGDDTTIDFNNYSEEIQEEWHRPELYAQSLAKPFSAVMIREENERQEQVMRAFYEIGGMAAIFELNSAPYAITSTNVPENVPKELSEEEIMDFAPDSPPPSVRVTSIQVVQPNLTIPAPSTLHASTSVNVPIPKDQINDDTGLQILSNVDIHRAAKNYTLPPPFPSGPKPVPPPAEELVILADKPSNLNAFSSKSTDVSDIFAKLKKSGGIEKLLEKTRIMNTPTSVTSMSIPTPSVTQNSFLSPITAPMAFPNFNVPPPAIPKSLQSVGIPPSVDDIVEVPIDIHSSGALPNMQRMQVPGGFRPPGPRLQQPTVPCRFFLRNNCTYGNNCHFLHQQPSNAFRPLTPRFSGGKGGGEASRGRFTMGKGNFNSSHQSSKSNQDNFEYSDSRRFKRREEYRGSNRRSPSPRRRRHYSSSPSPSPRRHSRSRSPPSPPRRASRSSRHSRDRSPSRSPPTRSPSRSPL